MVCCNKTCFVYDAIHVVQIREWVRLRGRSFWCTAAWSLSPSSAWWSRDSPPPNGSMLLCVDMVSCGDCPPRSLAMTSIVALGLGASGGECRFRCCLAWLMTSSTNSLVSSCSPFSGLCPKILRNDCHVLCFRKMCVSKYIRWIADIHVM